MMNRVELIGIVGQDPIFRRSKNGKEFATLSLATTHSIKNKETDEFVQATTWHNGLIAFSNKLNRVKFLKKGSKVYISGHLNYSVSENNGVNTYHTQIIIDDILFLDKKESENKSDATDKENAPEINQNSNEFSEDDIPF